MRKTWNLAWRHVGLYEAVQRCSLWCDEWGLFYCSLCFMHTMCAIAAILLWEVDTSWNYLKLFKCEVLIVNCFIPLRFMQHLKSLDDTIVLYCSATWEHNQFYKKNDICEHMQWLVLWFLCLYSLLTVTGTGWYYCLWHVTARPYCN